MYVVYVWRNISSRYSNTVVPVMKDHLFCGHRAVSCGGAVWYWACKMYKKYLVRARGCHIRQVHLISGDVWSQGPQYVHADHIYCWVEMQSSRGYLITRWQTNSVTSIKTQQVLTRRQTLQTWQQQFSCWNVLMMTALQCHRVGTCLSPS